MKTKSVILGELRTAIKDGVVTRNDIDKVFDEAGVATYSTKDSESTFQDRGNTVVRGLCYAAGIIMFIAVLSAISQTWESGLILHLFLTVVLGVAIWAAAYRFGKDKQSSDIRLGVCDALVLTGSLLLVTGGYIITNQIGSYGRVDFYQVIPALAVLALLHFLFFRILKRDIIYLFGIFLSVVAFGSLLFGILDDSSAAIDIWALVFIGLAGLLSWATHVTSRMYESTKHLQASHDRLAIFLSLFTMFLASFGDYAGWWYLAIAVSICGVYYLSIIKKQRILLGAASTFLVLTTVTVAFRYCSEFSLTASLLVSAAGILAVAALATQISRKYLA